MKRINKIGIEFEGEFSESLIAKLEGLGCMRKRDGSIGFCDDVRCYTNLQVAEMVTSPMRLDDDRIGKIFRALEAGYKKREYHFNESMGMHIHTSFKDGRSKVMPENVSYGGFAVRFARSIKKKFPSAYKAREFNSYCKLVERGEVTDEKIAERIDSVCANNNFGDRYSFLNHTAYHKHGTLEVRFWPADTPRMMKRYLEHTVAIFKEALGSEEYRTVATTSGEPYLMDDCTEKARTLQSWDAPFLRARACVHDEVADDYIDARFREVDMSRGLPPVSVATPESTITG